ncbi:MAG: YqgE/AlgH family protein [Proteobacteria bacterium]|nr:YqgE/AlgH family protein [Pseudomonadota bacterium]
MRRAKLFAGALLWCLFAALLPAASGGAEPPPGDLLKSGQLLIASSHMSDPRISGAVMLIVRHNTHGSIGVIVNRRLGDGALSAIVEGYKLRAPSTDTRIVVHDGGPVGNDRGLVLHSGDYTIKGTIRAGRYSLTSNPRLFADKASGAGPSRMIYLLGYVGWGPRELDDAIARCDWLPAEARDDLVFAEDPTGAWRLASARGAADLARPACAAKRALPLRPAWRRSRCGEWPACG